MQRWREAFRTISTSSFDALARAEVNCLARAAY
jgi:hypothetical protein